MGARPAGCDVVKGGDGGRTFEEELAGADVSIRGDNAGRGADVHHTRRWPFWERMVWKVGVVIERWVS